MICLLAPCTLISWAIRRSPFYSVLLAIRDAEPFAASAGARTSLIKVAMFGLSAAMAGLAGWVFSLPGLHLAEPVRWTLSVNILVMVILGGINSLWGPILGAAFISIFPDYVNIDPFWQEVALRRPAADRDRRSRRAASSASLSRTVTAGSARRVGLDRDPAGDGGEPPALAGRGARRRRRARAQRRIARASDGQPRRSAGDRVPRDRLQLRHGRAGARRRRLRRRAGDDPRPDRPERLRQEHAGRPDRRPDPSRTRGTIVVNGVRMDAARRPRAGPARVHADLPDGECWSAS